MSWSYGIYRASCGHDGCPEFARYEASNKTEYIDLSKRYGNGQYRCVRHSQPNEVLSKENTKIISEVKVFPESYGKFWGAEKAQNGFSHGLGYKAFAEDFPAGTILRVTAEIIMPEEP